MSVLHCTYDPDSKGGQTSDGRKVRGTVHWAGADAVKVELRLYDRLFNAENPADVPDEEFKKIINPDSLIVVKNCLAQGTLANAAAGDIFQFMRQGYFCADKDSTPDNPVFNRTVSLNSSWK